MEESEERCVKLFADAIGINMPLSAIPLDEFLELAESRMKRLKGEKVNSVFEERMLKYETMQDKSKSPEFDIKRD